MITEFNIKNFKSFSKSQTLPLAPITLIYGPNSAGKSSVIQSLMMLKQTLLEKEKDSDLVTSGEDIDLGTFESLIHGQNPVKEMLFSIKYKNQLDAKEFQQKYSYNMLYSNNDIRTVELAYKQFETKASLNHYKFICSDKNGEKVNYHVERGHKTSSGTTFTLKHNKSLRQIISKRVKLSSADGHGWNLLEDWLSEPFKIGSHLNIPSVITDLGTPLSDYTDKVLDDIRSKFEDIKYLGPLRSSPKRFYSDAISNYQKSQGKNNLGLDIYTASRETKEKINITLDNFHIPYALSAKDVGNINTGPLISVQLKDLRNGAVVTPRDVGFGIGQVLPIILDAIVSKKKVICVEQPEIHLHPKLQAHLADLFIDSSSPQNGNQWIIETHSEALMLRIQRRIREGLISKDLISVLYVDVGQDGAQVTQISLDEEGDFTTIWPAGFFEERLDEVFGE
ncbi:AAA family ATPase [Endozoicomonas gorgoniicola]|uniref:AAA family ATPase n=1 Tax=Endozoicomonas gorgoniicola TaxID=1234144 RepID=A0ABT3MX55_9GAMM|nr:AAA family ATPase [Endozoicomonas gorgoniicola]MCW7553951.1 AAA family ATPase [Endozoicomonas gorgoniicola]